MTRAGGVLAGSTLAVIVVGAILAGRPVTGGPLQEEAPSNAVTFSVIARTNFTYGGLQVHNTGDEPVVLDGVSLRGASDGLSIEDASVLRISDSVGGLWFNYHRYPPPGLSLDRLHPLAGFRVGAAQASSEGVQVLLALTVPSDGVFEFHEMVIGYHVGGRRYEATYPFAMRVCAPPVPLGGCPELDPAGTSGVLTKPIAMAGPVAQVERYSAWSARSSMPRTSVSAASPASSRSRRGR